MAGIFKYRKWKSLPLTATMEWLINGYNEEQGGDLNGYNGMTDLTAIYKKSQGAAGVDILHKLWRMLFFLKS
jgi:hypothetical protein